MLRYLNVAYFYHYIQNIHFAISAIRIQVTAAVAAAAEAAVVVVVVVNLSFH